MRTTIFIGIFYILGINIFAQEVSIKFNIDGYTEPIGQLGFHQGKSMRLQDTIAFDGKGNAQYNRASKLPEGIYFLYLSNGQWFDIIMNKDQTFEISTKASDVIANVNIKGNEENSVFYEFMKFSQKENKKISPYRQLMDSLDISNKKDSLEILKLRKKIKPISESVDAYRARIIKEHPDYFISKIFKSMIPVEVPKFPEIKDKKERQKKRALYNQEHYFDNLDFADERFVRTHQSILFDRLEYYKDNLMYPVPDSVINSIDRIMTKAKGPEMYKFLVFYFTKAYENSKLMCFDKVKLHMYQNYFLGDSRATWVTKETEGKLNDIIEKIKDNQCGNEAPSLVIPDSAGTKATQQETNFISLKSIKNKYVVLYFWSATCGHCKKTTPVLDSIYKSMKKKIDIEILTICIDDQKKKKEFKDYIAKHNFEWIIAWGDKNYNGFRTKYNVFSTPTMYLLDEDKKIIGKDLNPEMLERIVYQLEDITLPEKEEVKKEKTIKH